MSCEKTLIQMCVSSESETFQCKLWKVNKHSNKMHSFTLNGFFSALVLASAHFFDKKILKY